MFVYVDRINNPKSKNNGKWVVKVCDGLMRPMETVFMHESKKECIEYARIIDKTPIIGNGIEYGAKF